MTRPGIALAALAMGMLLLTPAAISAAPAPKVAIASLAQLPTPLPYPYNTEANAEADLAAAKARAKAQHRLLLIDLGGNWCADCRLLSALMEQPQVAAFVKAHYEVVSVDVGRYDRNMQIPARYGLLRLDGVPTLLVIDGHGKLVNAGHVFALTDARSMPPQALADWLAQWTP
jgi:thiol-disulfide isomerase/thioredoxin